MDPVKSGDFQVSLQVISMVLKRYEDSLLKVQGRIQY